MSCKSQKINNAWSKIDDNTKHVYAGMLITTLTSEVIYRSTHRWGVSIIGGFLTGVTAGIVKEAVWDGMMKRGVVNNWDAFGTMWGANVATIGFVISIDMEEKTKAINEEKFQNLGIELKKREEKTKNSE